MIIGIAICEEALEVVEVEAEAGQVTTEVSSPNGAVLMALVEATSFKTIIRETRVSGKKGILLESGCLKKILVLPSI